MTEGKTEAESGYFHDHITFPLPAVSIAVTHGQLYRQIWPRAQVLIETDYNTYCPLKAIKAIPEA